MYHHGGYTSIYQDFLKVGDPVSDWGQWTRIEDSISTRPSFKIDSDNPGKFL